MSFSSDIKQELNKNQQLNNQELVTYELIGYFLSSNIKILQHHEVKYTTESDYNINRFSKLLTNLSIDHKIEVVGKAFVIKIKKKNLSFLIWDQDQVILPNKNLKEEVVRAIVRGCFLGSGSINNPEKDYHLEIDFSKASYVEIVADLLEQFSIHVKTMLLENYSAIYIKEGEEISKFLAFIGAAKAVMQFEDIRIQREMRGKINRLVNCEAANLNKTMNASIEQIAAIQKLQEKGKFNQLEDPLKEIAMLRLKNPDMPLIELGKQLKEPVGKSGVNYRLKKIIEIAGDL